MTQTHYRACHLCEAICGLKIETRGEEILSIKGDPDDPLSRGHICPKAVALQDIHEDPDRLRYPVKRVSGEDGQHSWVEISWDEALDSTAEALMRSYREHGVDSIGVYLGNPAVHNYGMLTHQNYLFRWLRSKNRFSATSVDQLPHHLTSLWLFGHKSLFPIPDIDRSEYFLMLGANPLASNGSIWTVPDVKKRIKDMKARGGKLIVVDPRRTETAELASEHLPIVPGSDALFLAAMLNTLFEDGIADPGKLSAFTTGLDDVAAAVATFTPEHAAQHCGIEAATIRRIAKDFAESGAAICYGRMGVSTQIFGGLCQWLIQIINIVTGNLDKPGGSMFTLPAVDQVPRTGPGGFDRHRSRVRNLPEFDRELPAAAMAEEITTSGEGQIRVMFTGAGNPVLSTPNGRALDDALPQLDFMVSLDPYINETTRHAHIILPPTSPLEHDHYDIAFHINAMRNTTRYNPPVFEPASDKLHDWEIFTALGERVARALGEEPKELVAPHDMIDVGLQFGPYGKGSEHDLSLEKLKENPSGIDLGELQAMLPDRLMTADKQIHCAAPQALADLDRLASTFGDTPAEGLLLIGRRHVRSNNSWMHNYHRLVKGKPRDQLMVHPEDLSAHALKDGDQALLQSRSGEVTVTLLASDEVMPGVVSLPHGFGHNRQGIRMKTASANAGVSCNDVTDAAYLDELSGNAAINGVPVKLRAIA
ncbi:molybdopterin-dependent oxidoreductase [Congregibacter sp.]|uniref:molybdopterin-dependent oxidoreductase n=1 Tax=Congregibacter sp. TaxID=2744308 RepID=UPI00385B4D7D